MVRSSRTNRTGKKVNFSCQHFRPTAVVLCSPRRRSSPSEHARRTQYIIPVLYIIYSAHNNMTTTARQEKW